MKKGIQKMEIQYSTTKLRKATLELVEMANIIIAEYQAQGFELTVRQIYYQFVARGLIENTLKSYGYIGAALNKGRMCGLVDWEAIVDRTRSVYSNSHWNSPCDILEAAAQGYKLDTRLDQDTYIEVWIEKNALLGVIEPVCKELDVTYLPCIGYYSLSSMWSAAGRFNCNRDKECIVLHFGDHDPSGIDMTRDIQDRLYKFGSEVDVRRIALNMDQVKKYNPPPNPAKLSDSRAADYIEKYGTESWELDALLPDVIAKLIKKNVNSLTNSKKLQAQIALQEEQREKLHEIAEDYEDED